MTLDYSFGIDFGTTNSSTIGFLNSPIGEDYLSRRFEDEEGLPTPSFVAIDRDTGLAHVGREAWNRRIELAETCECVSSIKSLLDCGWSKEIAGRRWTAVDVAAEVFLALKKNAFERYDAKITKATVAVPIGFNPSKRHAVKLAAKKAGIEIESFVSEPTAAYVANFDKLKESDTVVVFDWGGGTLDVSVLKHEQGRLTELATNGLPLGGDDIDRKIALKIHAKVAREKGRNVPFDSMPSAAQDKMLVKAERAKRILSEDDDASINLNSYGEFGAFREALSAEWLDELVEPEIKAAFACLNKTIEDSGVGIANIDRVVMVGGTSNLRQIINLLEEKFGDKLFFPDETIWSIGEGAARLSVNPGKYHSAQDLGIVLSNGEFFPLLKTGESLLGWKHKSRFGIVDYSEEARVVFSGSEDLADSSDKYWTIQVPQYGFLQEAISLEAFVDENLVFSVIAKSSMRKPSDSSKWQYSKLKCSYELSELGL